MKKSLLFFGTIFPLMVVQEIVPMTRYLPEYSELANMTNDNLVSTLNEKIRTSKTKTLVLNRAEGDLVRLKDHEVENPLLLQELHELRRINAKGNEDRLRKFFGDLDKFLKANPINNALTCTMRSLNTSRRRERPRQPSQKQLEVERQRIEYEQQERQERQYHLQILQTRIVSIEQRLNSTGLEETVDRAQLSELNKALNQVKTIIQDPALMQSDSSFGAVLYGVPGKLDLIEKQLEWAIISASQFREISDLRQQVSDLRQQLEAVQQGYKNSRSRTPQDSI